MYRRNERNQQGGALDAAQAKDSLVISRTVLLGDTVVDSIRGGLFGAPFIRLVCSGSRRGDSAQPARG